MLVHPHVVDLAASADLLDPESQHPQAVLLEQTRSDLQVLMECWHIARRGFIGTELVNHLDTSAMHFVILACPRATHPSLYPCPQRPFPDAHLHMGAFITPICRGRKVHLTAKG